MKRIKLTEQQFKNILNEEDKKKLYVFSKSKSNKRS